MKNYANIKLDFKESKIKMDVLAISNKDPELLSEYSFDIDNYENKKNKIEMIHNNLSTILNGLIKNNNSLYKSLSEEFKNYK